MAVKTLLASARRAAPDKVWGAAVGLVRGGGVQGVSDDGEEVHLRVTGPGTSPSHEVYLWPQEQDWGCDCTSSANCCLHVCAAVIAHNQWLTAGQSLPKPAPQPKAPARQKRRVQVGIRYDLTSHGTALSLNRVVVHPDGTTEPFPKAGLPKHWLLERGDMQVKSLLATQSGPRLTAETLRRLILFLEGRAEATLNNQPVLLNPEPVLFQVRITDDANGFKAGLYRPPNIDQLFRGAALVEGALHPTSHGQLSAKQRKTLIKGVFYSESDASVLVNAFIPSLSQQIPVVVETDRLPSEDQKVPSVALHMKEGPLGLKVRAELVYGGKHPVARVDKGVLRAVGTIVPVRDVGAERRAVRRFESHSGLTVGVPRLLDPAEAAVFLNQVVPRLDGPVHGAVPEQRFRVTQGTLEPTVAVHRADDATQGSTWQLDVQFEGPEGSADPQTVLEAWRNGRSLVPLMDGGFAPLPTDWLKEHGAVLRELLEARDTRGRVDNYATAALVELLEGTRSDVPHDLTSLRHFLDEGQGLPDVQVPSDFKGNLRPYQRVGYCWLRFLRSMDIHGILADDMGLGKTIQTLAALVDAGGRSLVVAPTSVLRNWEREVGRFAPQLKVNVYHGPGRQLTETDLTLTSYTLLRYDMQAITDVQWTYAVLDEAQYIKNADSQTARAAYRLQAEHRLALTGTPVENRLEELWSQFHFLMPGLLGSQSAFKERFVKPIEAGNHTARLRLHRRVRPYVLRRLKHQVAPELPSLTDLVIRCQMSEAQRTLYETIRLAARDDVQRVLSTGRKNTFQVLEALLRMRQACCAPQLLPGDMGLGIDSAKLDRLEELLVEIVCEDHKALIFSQWTGLLDLVQPRLQNLGIEWVRLDGTTRNRQTVIDRFQSPGGPPVFLLSLKAGGTGLNLTAADYVVHLDPWWNPAVQQQATDRAYRIGQDRPVMNCRLIVEGTVEERILDLQDAKRDLADAALGKEGGFVHALSGEELRSLFEDSC